MRNFGWMTGSLVGLALVTGSVTPAEARPRYGHGGGWDRHRHHDGFGFGDAVGVAALVGAVAIVASSMSKDKQAAQARAEDAPPPRDDATYDEGAPPRDGTDYGRDTVDAQPDRDAIDAPYGSGREETAMTDACAVAARDEAQDAGGYAEVRHMDAPKATAAGYNIDGEVETRASWSASAGTSRRFTCSMKDGRIADVYLARDVAAR